MVQFTSSYHLKYEFYFCILPESDLVFVSKLTSVTISHAATENVLPYFSKIVKNVEGVYKGAFNHISQQKFYRVNKNLLESLEDKDA